MKKLLLVCVFLLAITGYSQSTITTAQWQEDLAFFKETVHKDYPFLFKKTTVAEFDKAVQELHDQIPNLEEHEVIIGFGRLVSMFKYGHTDISFRQVPNAFHRMPINLYSYNDGIHIQGVRNDYKDVLGAKLIAVEGMPIEKALKAIYPVVPAENDQYFKAFGINYLCYAEVLHAQGITDALKTSIALTFEKDGKTFERVIKAEQGLRPSVTYSHVLTKDNWTDARTSTETPLYLKNLDKIYHFEYLPEEKTVYVRQSQIQDDPSEDIPTFYARVFDFIEKNDVERMILDVRLNGGGNNYKNKPVVTGLIQSKVNEPGKLFVILGRRTFSACQNLVNELSNYTNAIFVGEPTSENINFYGDTQRLDLPNSELALYMSFAWWQDKPQWENADWLAPHFAVDTSFDEYVSGQDPVLEAAMGFDGENFIMNPMQHFTELFTQGKIDQLKADAAMMVQDPKYQFFDFEANFNKAGYQLLQSGQARQAVFVFELITQFYPNSANAWDSLAEGYWKAGDKAKAKEYYNKAISLDPDGGVGANARKMLKEMENE